MVTFGLPRSAIPFMLIGLFDIRRALFIAYLALSIENLLIQTHDKLSDPVGRQSNEIEQNISGSVLDEVVGNGDVIDVCLSFTWMSHFLLRGEFQNSRTKAAR
jgi:hypothetical protein